MERKYAKYILFKTIEESERFVKLYGGVNLKGLDFYERYFGKKIKGKYLVLCRFSKRELDEVIRCIKIKKHKYNGKLIYSFD